MSLFLQSSLRTFGLFFIAIALFSLVGGHWAVLQTVAWAQMIHTYAEQDSLSSAVEKTLSGKHRCSLCKKIAQAQQHEKKSSTAAELLQKKKMILASPFVLSLFIPAVWNYTPLLERNYTAPFWQPLLLPPRTTLGLS